MFDNKIEIHDNIKRGFCLNSFRQTSIEYFPKGALIKIKISLKPETLIKSLLKQSGLALGINGSSYWQRNS